MKKTPLMIQVDPVDRCRIEMLSARWGDISLSATVRRVLEEYIRLVDSHVQSTPAPRAPEPVAAPEPEPTQEELDLAVLKKKNAGAGLWLDE